MRRTTLVALAALLATAACEPQTYESQAASPAVEVTQPTPEPLPAPNPAWAVAGFDDLPWGTTREQIRAHRGEPFTSRPGPEGLSLLVYQGEEILSYTAQKVYMVSRSGRLTGGGWVVHAQSNCGQVLRDLIALVEERYPALKRIATRDADSCTPNTQVMWEDPSSGAAIAVVRDEFQGAVQITYIAPDALEEEVQAAEEREAERRAEYERSKAKTRDRL